MKFSVKIHLLMASTMLSILSFSSLYATIFTVKNSSKNPIYFFTTTSDNKNFPASLKPRQQKTISAGSQALEAFVWRDIPDGKFYKLAKKISSLNIGGVFEVKNNGKYYYYFGNDEEASGVADVAVDPRSSLKFAVDPRSSLKF